MSDHDWRAEASGLAYMIATIAGNYKMAKELLGGDSELLASSIYQAKRYIDGPLLELMAGEK